MIVSQLFAQREFHLKREMMQMGNFYNSEIHYFPSPQGFKFYYIFKIPYSQLFFEKDNDDHFTSGITVNIEITDSSSNLITRGFDERTVSVTDFDRTTSKTETLQGLISLILQEGHYKLSAIISDKTSKRERRIPPVNLNLTKEYQILHPLVLEQNNTKCDKSEVFIVSNNSSFIPFNKPQNILAIPVLDSTLNSLTINVKRRDTVLVSGESFNQTIFADATLNLCDDKIVIPLSTKEERLRYFLFNAFSAKLSEGPIRIEVIPNQDSTKKKIFMSDVIWIGKPRSLLDAESAIELLSIIDTEQKVNQLLNSDDYKAALNDYWQKLDPTPDTKYNELMNEFYQRVDYCQETFKSIDGSKGAYSDRGKIYIIFGPPNKIERNSSNSDKVVETWFYDNQKKKFVFVDNDGTGKYSLVSEQ